MVGEAATLEMGRILLSMERGDLISCLKVHYNASPVKFFNKIIYKKMIALPALNKTFLVKINKPPQK